MIEYLYTEGRAADDSCPILVKVGAVIHGEIRKVTGGYQYYSFQEAASKSKHVCPSVKEVQSLLKSRLDVLYGEQY
jgi:hypothetical protein